MNKEQARQLIKDTFEKTFDKGQFITFIKNLLNEYEPAEFSQQGNFIKDSYKPFISKYERIGKFFDGEKSVDILIVYLKKEKSLERARTMQRNFISWYLNGGRGGVLRDAALVAYISPDSNDWRFSLVKMDYRFDTTETGKIKVKEEFTPARRWSFLVGKNEKSHTAQSRLVPILEDDKNKPTLTLFEEAFNIEKVTKEFFEEYRELFIWTKEMLDNIIKKDYDIKSDFENKKINTVDFAKKLLGQIVFLYFLQKKGWFGVQRGKKWGEGSKFFLRELFCKKHGDYGNLFNDILEPLFYEALRIDRSHDDNYYSRFNCKIPFLNGGLFDPINNYDWVNTDILLPNELFSNKYKNKEGDLGTGIFDVFDRFNFTVKEDEPLEKEVAVDPEMLGKVFENLLDVKDRKSKGSYYTPREIVHYMCQQSLINYLYLELNKGQLDILISNNEIELTKEDIENFIIYGDLSKENEARVKYIGKETKTYRYEIVENIRINANIIDVKLAGIKICDPAVGSGAFLVGMMTEVVKARDILSLYIKDKNRTHYDFKRECIENSLYGVDIDFGAIEIAKLRLWLSLVVDEDDINVIKPLPNLDYKVVCGNSLLGLPDGILLNDETVNKIELYKKEHINTTNPKLKNKLKEKIDKLILDLISDALNLVDSYPIINFDFHIFFPEVLHDKKGFDIFIGNPPYVGQKGHKEIFQEIKKTPLGKKYHQRRMDLFYFFFHLALEKVRPDGIISFITTNYFLTATYSDKLRNHLHNSSSILLLLNFNEFRIFESAQGQHNLITLLKNGRLDKIIAKTAISKRIGLANNAILNSILYNNDPFTSYYLKEQENIFDKETNYIRIEPDSNLKSQGNTNANIYSILEKIKNKGELLNKYCFIEQGIVSGADKVSDSIIKKYPSLSIKKGEGIYILTNEEIDKLKFSDFDKQLLKKTYKNSDLKKWLIETDDTLNVIYLKSNGKYFEISRGVKNHLDRFKLILINRNVRVGSITEENYNDFLKGNFEISYIMNANSLKNGNYYCLSYARRGKDTFEVDKIVNSRRAISNIFAYESNGYYEQSDIVITTLKPEYNNIVDLKFILAILNSKLYYYWFYYKGKRKGEFLELFQKPISEVPIKIVSQGNIVKVVEKILATKKVDFNRKKLENEIDIMVYKLYELTYNEVKIVDPEIEKIITKKDYENLKI